MNKAEYLTSPLLSKAGFRHAFFTRGGGASEGPFRSLNFSVSVGDAPERVGENLRRAASALGVSPGELYFAAQVHGARTLVVRAGDDRERVATLQADALVAETPGVACAVRHADCVPILVGDRGSGAALAIHAGWRGLVARVIAEGLAELRRVIGSAGDLVAAIGPHISLASFEVSSDVAHILREASPDALVVDEGRAKPHVDLRRIARALLREQGLAEESIDDVPGCTFAEEELFFSYRRDGAQSGRHLSAIVSRSPA